MKRREAIKAKQEDRRPNTLNEIVYLLGVHDLYRLGALRIMALFITIVAGNYPQLMT
jgi:hypothetical protein